MADKEMINSEPIGIFDSGMGGLTVLKAAKECLPHENLIYFGDTVHLPYGNKSPEAIIRYSSEAAEFLLKKNIKLLVIACNTASVYALKHLRETLSIPVIGVVESGVKAALASAESSIAVIGTHGTIKSGLYTEKIRSYKPSVNIFSRACPLFVPLVEEGWLDNHITEQIVNIYLNDLIGKIDSIILACTHYPMLKNVISRVLGPEVSVVDSATEVIKTVKEVLEEKELVNEGKKPGNINFYVSDSPENFSEVGRLFLNEEIKDIELYE